jgi:hypothetical protein
MKKTDKELKTAEAKLRESEDARKRRMQDSPFYCMEQFHLADLGGPCAYLYPILYKVAKPVPVGAGEKWRIFHASAESLATYFGVDTSTIGRGLRKLAEAGFIELLKQTKFKPNSYRIFSHKEWAALHPGLCAAKLQFPFSGEIDTLGQTLLTISGGTVKFQRFQVNNIRKLGVPELDVYTEFATYMEGPGKTEPVPRIPTDFYIKLKKQYSR